MADDLDAVFGRADGPRALPAQLRARLGDALLAEVAATPEPEDAAVAARLTDVDADRPLPVAVRDRLRKRLHEATAAPVGHRSRRAVLVGTAAGLIAVLGGGIALTAAVMSGTAEPGKLAGAPRVTQPPSSAPEGPPLARAPKPKPADVGAVAGPSTVGSGSGGDFLGRRVERQRLGWSPANISRDASMKESYVRLTAVSPAFGPTEGGTRVVIRGADLGDVRDVRFGGVRSPWVDARTPGRVVVITPAVSSAGRVGVTLRGAGVFIRIPHAYSYAFPGPGTWF